MLAMLATNKAARYRKRAEEIRKVANGIHDDTERARLMEIAKDYEQLAGAK
jgi:hypothetical protein